MPIQHYIIEGNHLGSAAIPLTQPTNIGFYPLRSLAYFCPYCADIWARFPIEGDTQEWAVLTHPCRKHPSRPFAIAGSTYAPSSRIFPSPLPEPLLAWELQRHLDYFEQGQDYDYRANSDDFDLN